MIHPTAVVDPKAEISPTATIGAYCVIGPKALLADNCVVAERATINWTKMGEGARIGANTIIGGDPQVYNWKSVPSWVEIGPGAFVNELSAVHRSMYENGVTIIGPGSFVMTQTHVGHDCHLGREVTVTTFAGLSGHVTVGDYAVIGGAAGIHQFTRVGAMAMIGGMCKVTQDVPPYFMVDGAPAWARGLNLYALKKRGINPAERSALKKAFHMLARSGYPVPEALQKIEETLGGFATVKALVEFARGAKRGLTLGRPDKLRDLDMEKSPGEGE